MEQKIFITLILTLILYTHAKVADNDVLSCKSIENPSIRQYSLNEYQSIEQRNILVSEKNQRKFQNDMLNTHNILRKQHCVPPLILDDQISATAQAYAEYLANQDSRLVHSDRKALLGENLYSTTTSNPITNSDDDKITRAWYNEIVHYNFDIPGFVTNAGHFTQLVWKDTQKLGIGIAFAKEGRKMYVVAQYSPPGNNRQRFKTNVFPAKC